MRKTIEALEQIKGMPPQGDVEVGEVPSLMDLGLNLPPEGQVWSIIACLVLLLQKMSFFLIFVRKKCAGLLMTSN